jgi:hypothetical protein
VAKNDKTFRAFRKLTRKLVFPIAIVLLPGGLVLLAFHWVRKFVAADGKAARADASGMSGIERTANRATTPEFLAFMRLINKGGTRAEIHCQCIRRGSKRRLPQAPVNNAPARVVNGTAAEALS